MPQFTDKKNQIWQVNLDPVIADEIKQKHGIQIVNLESDPLLKLRNDPMTLVSVLFVICQEQIQAAGLTPEQFAKQLPFPPDDLLKAVTEAIACFFPTGRASHVREVLAGYETMSAKTDELTTVKMRMVMDNPLTQKRLSDAADREIEAALNKLNPTASAVGT